jgi:phospholipid/cholesterol/gamma-HCH transport system substrate-binding protein
MTQAARDALRKVDSVLSDNAGALKETVGNLKTFSAWLADNTGKLDGIIGGIERMTGADKPVVVKAVYDLRPASGFAGSAKAFKGQLAIAEPTAVVMFDTQKLLLAPGLDLPGFAGAQWSDSIPKLLQAKLIQSFENYDIGHAPLRANDSVQTDYQLLIDIRSFQLAGEGDPNAEIAFSARILNKDGHLLGSKLLQASAKLDKPEPVAAVAAFNAAFDSIAKELVTWTVDSLAAAGGPGGDAKAAIPGSSGTTKGR